MAASTPSPSMSSVNRMKPKKPLDIWSTREKLCLASAVYKIGDQNWVSVSRAIKPYMEPKRPPEWFHQKNCVSQYYDMLEQLEQPKRKRGDRSETDTPSLQIMRKMTIERSEQLKKEIMEMQQAFKQLQAEVEAIKAGQWDDRLPQEWENIKAEQKIKEEAEAVKVEVTDDVDQEELKVSGTDRQELIGLPMDTDETTQDSQGENVDISVLTDEEANQSSTSTPSTSLSTSTITSLSVSNKLPAASHLLSSLLKSDVKTATELQQLKNEQEQEQGQQQLPSTITPTCQRSLLKTPITQDDPLTTAPSSTKGSVQGSSSTCTTSGTITTLISPTIQHDGLYIQIKAEGATLRTADTLVREKESSEITLKSCKVDVEEDDNVPTPLTTESIELEDLKSEEVVIKTEESVDSVAVEEEIRDFSSELDVEGVETIKEETDKDSQDEDYETPLKQSSENIASEAELTESSVKDEPLSPTSSVSSRISETGSKRGSRNRGRSRSSRLSRVSTRKSNTDDERKDDASSRHSDVELSEDDVPESDFLAGVTISGNPSSLLSESFPNSPASLSMCSDTEEEKSFKQWKKSIMLVWRAAATHKFANVFLHPVTDEIAPGYRSVVLRPMDLSTIKKNVETGVIRTTVDFQRDMMLMFSNAIMYNSSDHNVYRMATEMYNDVMQHIEQYVNTQIMVQNTDSKNLRQSRRPDASDKEDESKKRRLSVEHSEGGKSKKRKTRLDESLP